MNKKQEVPINVHRVLELCINDPTSSKNFNDFIKLRSQTSEFRIRDALRLLEKENILTSEYKRGRPRIPYAFNSQSGPCDSKFGSKIYRLNLELAIFEKLFNIFNKKDYEALLKSNYVSKMIEIYTFKDIYNKLEDEFKNQHFRRNASRILLDLPSAIKEYEGYPDKVYNHLQDCREHFVRLEELWFDEVQILENLDPIVTIPFIRSHLIDNLMDLYKKIGGRNIHIRSPDGLRLTKLDMHLSPFFSYPFFDPIQVIFSKPFDRLYDDMYILNKADLGVMAERIYLVYKNFAEFLSIFQSTDWRYSICLESSLREYIFLWNCQSYYFSEFYYRYKLLFSGERKYYITSNCGFIQIIDLIENKKMITPQDSFSIKSEITYPPLYTEGNWGGSKSNPFEVLLPCRSLFDEFGFDSSEIPIDTILDELKKKVP